ncbi:hypothetical protein PENSPDRAFT_183458 [Peniophora sp. CONT]|nr:hypothetical protein PENSPDRAFT_183458 [Peniophora sp. CONT]
MGDSGVGIVKTKKARCGRSLLLPGQPQLLTKKSTRLIRYDDLDSTSFLGVSGDEDAGRGARGFIKSPGTIITSQAWPMAMIVQVKVTINYTTSTTGQQGSSERRDSSDGTKVNPLVNPRHPASAQLDGQGQGTTRNVAVKYAAYQALLMMEGL